MHINSRRVLEPSLQDNQLYLKCRRSIRSDISQSKYSFESKPKSSGNPKNMSSIFQSQKQEHSRTKKIIIPEIQENRSQGRKQIRNKNQGHGIEYLYNKENVEIKKKEEPQQFQPLYLELSIQEKKSRDLRYPNSTKTRTETSLAKSQQDSIQKKTESVTNLQPKKQEIKKISQTQVNRPPRPLSAPKQLNDRDISFIQLNLKNLQKNQDSNFIQQLFQKNGFHVVNFQKEYNKINNQDSGNGVVQIRGVSNDNKLYNLNKNLLKQCIQLKDEPSNKIKDLIDDNYIKKQNLQKQQKNSNKLLENYERFQLRKS
ncbi:hypothetical protein pb186bvf_019405 [Paramecium bursaria]